MKTFFLWALLIMSLAMSARAEDTNQPPLKLENLLIQSENGAEWDFASGVAVFRGNVVVTNPPSMLLKCQKLTAHFGIATGTNEGIGSIENIVAEEKVEIYNNTKQGAQQAVGDKAVYTATNDVVTLTGNPVTVSFPGGGFTSSTIVWDRKTSRISVPQGMTQMKFSNFMTKPFGLDGKK